MKIHIIIFSPNQNDELLKIRNHLLLSIVEMVSLDENPDTSNINNADYSDAPIEVTTKTSKTEKKKKKKKTKRRIKYATTTKENNDRNDKYLDEESSLTHLVFGDDDDYLEELTSKATGDERV